MWCRTEGRVRQGLPEKVTFEKRCLNEGVKCISGGKVFQGRRNSLCKCPEAEVCLEWLRNSEEASVAGIK